MQKKTGRPRKYDGDDKQRHAQAVQNYNKKVNKQLNIKMKKQVYEQIKQKAQQQNMTVRAYILKKLLE